MRLLGIPTVSELHRALDDNPALRRVCGMDRPRALPSTDTIRRVRRRLAGFAGSLREAIGETITELKKYLPDLGDEVEVDSTKIRSYPNANRDPKSDPEASWGRRSKAGAKDGYELALGHSLQVVADANHDLPLALRATTGSRNDSPEFVPLMELFESLGLDPRVVIADRGCDSKRNNRWPHERGIAPVIHLIGWGDDTRERKCGFRPASRRTARRCRRATSSSSSEEPVDQGAVPWRPHGKRMESGSDLKLSALIYKLPTELD